MRTIFMRKCVLFATKYLTEEAFSFFTIIHIEAKKVTKYKKEYSKMSSQRVVIIYVFIY